MMQKRTSKIPVLISALIGIGVSLFTYRQWLNEKWMIKRIEGIASDSLRIEPRVKEILFHFPVQNGIELRSMPPPELIELLACCSLALSFFERSVEEISVGYSLYEKLISGHHNPFVKFIDSIFGAKEKESKKRKYAHLKEKLSIHINEVLDTFERELMIERSVLHLIPEKYRFSFILGTMCGYLEDGEAESWEGCIKICKAAEHQLNQHEDFKDIADTFEMMKNNTKQLLQSEEVKGRNWRYGKQ
ncbi:MAG: hypothetical protein FWE11_01690 [Defluviitaleaceae bacterium]|nr:hypothetical protein [Defluviitaleaceae bacterium]